LPYLFLSGPSRIGSAAETLIHREISHERNIHNVVAASRLEDDERFSIGMNRDVFLTGDLDLRRISQAHGKRSERLALHYGFDDLGRHSGSVVARMNSFNGG
jgi:hypothetical protein